MVNATSFLLPRLLYRPGSGGVAELPRTTSVTKQKLTSIIAARATAMSNQHLRHPDNHGQCIELLGTLYAAIDTAHGLKHHYEQRQPTDG